MEIHWEHVALVAVATVVMAIIDSVLRGRR